jgi:hypothetical protein
VNRPGAAAGINKNTISFLTKDGMGSNSQKVINMMRSYKIVLTAGNPLMYYPQVGIFYLLMNKDGRLLKLVDRTDLGSVGDEP